MTLTREEINAFVEIIIKDLTNDLNKKMQDLKKEIQNKVEGDLVHVNALLASSPVKTKVFVESYPGKLFSSPEDVKDMYIYKLMEDDFNYLVKNVKYLQNFIITESIGFDFNLRSTEEFIRLIKDKYVSSNTKTK